MGVGLFCLDVYGVIGSALSEELHGIYTALALAPDGENDAEERDGGVQWQVSGQVRGGVTRARGGVADGPGGGASAFEQKVVAAPE